MTSTQTATKGYNMEDGPIFSGMLDSENSSYSYFIAEQINVPAELALVLKLYTKAVIRAQPKDVVQFSRE
jgi:hypothetical protein